MAGDRTRRSLAQHRLEGEVPSSTPLPTSDTVPEPPVNAPNSPRSKLDDRMQRWFVERDRFEMSRKRPPPEPP